MEIAFIGLGNMGAPMARNLLRAGYKVTVWNRSADKAQALVAAGAKLAATPAKAVTAGGKVVTMLSDDAALEAVVLGKDGFAKALGAGLHISMSTVSPALNRRLAQAQVALGGSLVAAPVFGRPDAAAAAKLNIPCSGPAAARARAMQVLQVLGQRVQDFGEDVGAANVVKLCGNFLILSATQAMAETLAVGRAAGLDAPAMMDFYTTTNFACPVYQAYGSRLANEDYSPGFKLGLAAKDLRLFSEQAGAEGLPLRAMLTGQFKQALDHGLADQDATALAQLLKK